MTNKPRFTLEFRVRDNYNFEPPISMALDLDSNLRVSSRDVEDLKMGAEIGMALITATDAIRMMKVKEFRREAFVATAVRLANLMADRMEDAEGWHDTSRIDPARKEIGGKW